MNDQRTVEEIWYFFYNNILLGRVSMVVSLVLLIFGVFIFIRWRMFGVSLLFLTVSLGIAYLGGVLKMFEGVL